MLCISSVPALGMSERGLIRPDAAVGFVAHNTPLSVQCKFVCLFDYLFDSLCVCLFDHLIRVTAASDYRCDVTYGLQYARCPNVHQGIPNATRLTLKWTLGVNLFCTALADRRSVRASAQDCASFVARYRFDGLS